MKEYKIRFCNDKEFEALSLVNPRYVNTKDDLGFADMETDRIFVRKTGVPFLDQFVTNHEIEEILAKNSTHQDEFNIRHKKVFKEIIAPYVLPVVGALLGGPAGAALGIGATAGGALGGAAASAIGQAGTTGKVQPLPTILSGIGGGLTGAGASSGIAASKAVGGGYLGQTLSGAQSALGIQSGAQKMLTPTPAVAGVGGYGAGTPVGTTNMGTYSAFPAGYLGGQLSQGIPAIAGQAGYGAGTPTGTMNMGNYSTISPVASSGNLPAAQTLGMQTSVTKAGAEAALPQGMGTAGTGMGVGGVATETAKQVSKTPMLEKLLGANWRQTLLGTAIPLLGQSVAPMFGATPTPEPFTPEQSALFNETANMIRQGAQVQLNPAQTQAISAQYDTALEQARQNIMDRYKMLRPGSDIENDSNMREALTELETEIAEKKANALASAQLGLSQTQTQMMSELAAMDIYTLAMKAGIKYQEAADFKNMLGSLGFMVAKSGQPVIYKM